ncbi:MAG: cupin domain-containing protein [Burkholderiales bacterium]|jgi:quercetin dioxygenase-like cupin family protein
MTATTARVPTEAERAAFEAQLRADGYDEILTKTLEPNVEIPLHTHPYDVRALVLDGEATIDCGQGPRTYRPGDVLVVERDLPHSEVYGPAGYTFLLGRRHARG